MKLNNKGYMLIEIIVSFAIAFAIVISFTNLIIKFKDINTDTYYSANFLKNKTLITRNIMEDLERGKIVNALKIDDNTIEFEFRIRDEFESDGFRKEQRRLQAINTDGVTKIVYGKIENGSYDKSHVSYYEKALDPSLVVSSMNILNEEFTTSAVLNISVSSLYSDEVYDINFFSEIVEEKKLYRKYILTFNANGGELEEKTREVTYNDFYGDLPIPTKAGYTFGKWYKSLNFYSYEIFNDNQIYTLKQDLTLYAKWDIKSFTLTYNANGGTCPTCASKTIKYGEKYGPLPEASRSGYTFLGWYDNDIKKYVVNEDRLQAEKDKVLVAKWEAKEYNVTFKGNGGSPDSQTKKVTYDSLYGELPKVERSGYEFTGWYTAASGGNIITKDTTVKITSNQTLYAHWSDVEYTVTFNGNGGSPATQTKTVNKGGTYGELPEVSRDGYNFLGWYTAASGGTKVTTTTNITQNKDHTLYAHWETLSYKITFDGNGGTPSYSTKQVKKGGTYGTLPTATRDSYEFIGWYTAKTGGTKITSSTKVSITGPQTLYAQWRKFLIYVNGKSGSDYNDGSTPENSVETLKKAYSIAKEISENSNSTQGTIYIVDTVYIDDTITLDGTYYKDKSNTITLATGKSVILKRYSKPKNTITGYNVSSNTNSMIRVTSNGVLTLEKLTIDGHNDEYTGSNEQTANPVIASFSMLYIKNGTVNIKNAILQNNTSISSYGGAIYNNAGTLNMEGGTITSNIVLDPNETEYVNAGGAIAIYNGVMTMTKGVITKNESSCAGGGIYGEQSQITLTGGTISSNNAKCEGGGIWVNYGTLTISGGAIIKNKSSSSGGGICVWDEETSLTINAGTISQNEAYWGGGIWSPAYFTINGGTISSNTATDFGGGIGAWIGLEINGGTISNNTSKEGGGIYAAYKEIKITAGTITKNSATLGGGIFTSDASIVMTGGTISSNTATESGGGIYINNHCIGAVKNTGGIIQNNTAGSNANIRDGC